MHIEEWLKTHTFHYSDFADINALIEKKEAQNLTISLCIPTFNEEKTIGKEIVLFKSELQQRYPLLDEIAVIDSGSRDRTCEMAENFGAQVYLASDILPNYGDRRGKGENLWKAIYQLTGDIIIYVDADIKNIHPRFAYGLVGPLICHPDIKYIKAFYDRPLAQSTHTRPLGGGRVTEILVRPLFSLFFPELTAIIQPLSGEYAVRREVLEKISFPVGYGVESSHLLDVYQQWGLQAFGQTDLDRRVHRNQSTRDLGKMAFGIMQTILLRMRSLGLVQALPEINTILRQFQISGTHYQQIEYEIPEKERPPMISIPEYREKRKLHA